MSEPDKINWFLRGLSPTLKPHCLTDHLGVFWSDLGDLITFAYAKESMLKVKASYVILTLALLLLLLSIVRRA